MPKETVHSVLGDRIVPEFDVSVMWNRDGSVQVVTTAKDADERLRNWQEMPDAAPTPLTAGAPGTSFKTFSGWHVDLDRAGVNRLIRVLRQARDAAFGKDE